MTMLKLTVNNRVVPISYERVRGYHTFRAPSLNLTVTDLDRATAWTKFRAELDKLAR